MKIFLGYNCCSSSYDSIAISLNLLLDILVVPSALSEPFLHLLFETFHNKRNWWQLMYSKVVVNSLNCLKDSVLELNSSLKLKMQVCLGVIKLTSALDLPSCQFQFQFCQIPEGIDPPDGIVNILKFWRPSQTKTSFRAATRAPAGPWNWPRNPRSGGPPSPKRESLPKMPYKFGTMGEQKMTENANTCPMGPAEKSRFQRARSAESS